LQRIQYAKTISDAITKADGTYVPKEKRKKQEEKGKKLHRPTKLTNVAILFVARLHYQPHYYSCLSGFRALCCTTFVDTFEGWWQWNVCFFQLRGSGGSNKQIWLQHLWPQPIHHLMVYLLL
jgi:hypothetical protein